MVSTADSRQPTADSRQPTAGNLISTRPHPVIDTKNRYVCDRVAGRDVLDIGCVMHEADAYIKEPNWLHADIRRVAGSLLGLDIDAVGVAELQRAGFNVVVGDAQDFDLGRQFDFVVAGDLIEHLANPGLFLDCARAHLRPGGGIIVQTPNPWYWVNTVKAGMRDEVANNPEHTCWFDPVTLRQLAERHGLRVEEVYYHTRSRLKSALPLPKQWRHSSWSATLRVAA